MTLETLLALSLTFADRAEPRFHHHKPMARELGALILANAASDDEAALGVVYSWREGGYSTDPHLAGDCKGLPAGSRACTADKAQHWCTLQVEPMPATLSECVSRWYSIIHAGINPATGGTASSFISHARETAAQALLTPAVQP